MAQDTIDKIINIQFNYGELVQGWQKATREIEINKKNLAELKQEYKNGEMSASEYNRALLEITSTTKALTAEKKAYEKEIQNNIKIESQETGSLNQLRASLQKMTAQYNAMSAARREGQEGRLLAASIKSQQEAINEAEMALGNYRSQVGSYKDSILQALGINQQFTKSISMLKSPLGVVAGAAAACVAVFKLFKSSIHETQSTGDAFDYAMAGWRTTWDLFKKSVSTVDFSVFIRNAVEAREAGEKLAQVLDELFERTNSITLQEGAWKKERAELEVIMRDVTKSYEERLEAGNKLLEGDQKIADQRKKAAEDERDAQLGILFDLTKTRKYASEEEKDAAREEFAARIQSYNLTLDQIRAANAYKKATDDASKSLRSMGYNKNVEAANNKAIAESYDNLIKSITTTGVSMEDAKKQAADYVDFVTQYNLTNDKQVKAYVDAQQKVYEADAQVIIQNKRNLTTLKSLEKQQTDEAKKGAEKRTKILKQAAKTQLDLEKQLSKSILELRQASLEKDLELSRLRFSWERQELENKLKYDKTLTAESREAINQLILNMEERRYKEESEIRQRWSDKEFEEEARNAENRIKMRIKVQEEMDKLSLAQVKNRNYAGLIGDDKDARIKAQQAVANEELRIAQSKYDAISQMDEEQWSAQYGSIQAYEMARLDAENNVQDAIKKTTDLSIASQNQAIKVQLDELAAASSLVGSLRGLFGALGDDLEAFAIAEQALAVAQIIIDAQKATMEAMVASFQLGPIAGPIWFATQKGIITAQAAIASATTLAQAIPSFFSEGGLVTGPGTGTSDSIPAMLSNGEAVMTAQAVNDWGAMLSAMNVASGGNAIQVSNLPQRNDGMRGMKAMIREAMLDMPAPIVSVVDINKGQKRVKVQNSLGKLGRKKYE